MLRLSAVAGAFAAQRGRLFAWCPVLVGAGAGLWLVLPWEPGAMAYGLTLLAMGLGLGVWRRAPFAVRPMGAGVLCVALGFAALGLRSEMVSGPVLAFRYYGPIEGRVVQIDRSQSDNIRLTLDHVILENTPPARTPRRVRVTLHGDQGFFTPDPGQRVIMTGHLSALEGPVEPGGFDFQRMGWFRGLGAVGYARSPVLLHSPAAQSDQRINRLRMRISGFVQAASPGEAGAFAAAVLTGDRSGVSTATTKALRDSNLAHLLAISGLHMGLLTGFVFVSLRVAFACVPPLALRLQTKKLAAAVALLAAAFYLLLSGGNIATQRAFVMVAVMLVAVMADRRAISLRSVALAAMILLALHPEAVAEPGFQMSFAATTALIAGFAALRDRASLTRVPRLLRPVLMLVVSSALAGLATAPVAAAHFNRIAEFGLLANVLAVPVMGTLVIPMAVLAAILAPFGAAAPALWAMELGTRWILRVAEWVAVLPGAVRPVPVPEPLVLPALALGGLWLILWRGRAAWAGLVPIIAAIWVWSGGGRPPVLVSADAGLVGLMTPLGRAVSAPRGNGFAAAIWLENDGDGATQAEAALRPGFAGPRGDLRFDLGAARVAHLTGKGAEARLTQACAEADLVIIAVRLNDAPPRDCRIIDAEYLLQTGPIALRLAKAGYQIIPTRNANRRWNAGSLRQ